MFKYSGAAVNGEVSVRSRRAVRKPDVFVGMALCSWTIDALAGAPKEPFQTWSLPTPSKNVCKDLVSWVDDPISRMTISPRCISSSPRMRA